MLRHPRIVYDAKGGTGMKIVIVDGQGGKLGKLLVEQVKQKCP